MRPAVLGLGIALLAVTVVDLVWTSLWVEEGAGPLSSRLMAGVWTGVRRVAGGNSRVLSLVGPLLVVLTFTTWVGLLWAGWTLVFTAGEDVLFRAAGDGPITWSDRAYFVGYTIFTLGIGDVVPRGGVWRLLTVLTTASGLFLITMSISYVLSVVDAVSRKRSFASNVTALGGSGEALVVCAWDGESFSGLGALLVPLAQQVDELSYQYKAYPILHHYHSQEDFDAPAVAIAIFDEALTVLECGVPGDSRPNEVVLQNARASASDYLATLSTAFIQSAERRPPPPDLDVLREAGVPTVSDDEFAAAVEELSDRRRALLGMIESDAREWPAGRN